jgi:hypothetical protein
MKKMKIKCKILKENLQRMKLFTTNELIFIKNVKNIKSKSKTQKKSFTRSYLRDLMRNRTWTSFYKNCIVKHKIKIFSLDPKEKLQHPLLTFFISITELSLKKSIQFVHSHTQHEKNVFIKCRLKVYKK